MKICKRPDCKNEVARPEMVYCSAQCAPWSKLADRKYYPKRKGKSQKKMFNDMSLSEKISYVKNKQKDSSYDRWLNDSFRELIRIVMVTPAGHCQFCDALIDSVKRIENKAL
jgi:hypothetical protein